MRRSDHSAMKIPGQFRLENQHPLPRLLNSGARKLLADQVRGSAKRIGVKVSVARRCRRLRVAEQLANDGKPKTCARADRCERVPQVVNSKPLKSGA